MSLSFTALEPTGAAMAVFMFWQFWKHAAKYLWKTFEYINKKKLSLKSRWTEKLSVPSGVEWQIEFNFC